MEGHCCKTSCNGGVGTTTIGNIKHNCCDICIQECTCSLECPFQGRIEPNDLSDDDNDDNDNKEFVWIITQGDRDD